MQTFLEYLKVFAVGGALCAVGEFLIDKTKLTPGRILSLYVVAGVVLGAAGIYGPLTDFAGAGASVPLTGFGSLLAKGVRQAVAEKGALGCLYRWLYRCFRRHMRRHFLRFPGRAHLQAAG